MNMRDDTTLHLYTMPQYGWNTAKVGVQHQLIHQLLRHR